MESFDVIAVGLATVDFLVRVPAGSRRGGKTAVREIAVAGGGPAATVPARLGFRTALNCRIGDDDFGRLIREQLDRDDISGQLKVGSFSGSERLAKWNEVLRIQDRLGERARFAGGLVFAGAGIELPDFPFSR